MTEEEFSARIRVLDDFFPTTNYTNLHELSNPFICAITLRQLVLSANNTNAIRVIDGLKRFVLFVIAQAILRVMGTAASLQFRENSCNSW